MPLPRVAGNDVARAGLRTADDDIILLNVDAVLDHQ